MKLLIITQVVDKEDLYLGFFHRWLEELAPRFERIEVVCLREGSHALPENVRVYSLGKERGPRPSYVYALRFLALAFKLRKDYDAALVHMNQEYVLLAGFLWEVLGKRVYLWRNHYAGSWLTDLAASFCRKVFYTSKHSYTAKYSRAVRMPVGVDAERFHPMPDMERVPRSILFFGRMMSSKRPGLLLDALIELKKLGMPFTATFAGSPPEGEEEYLTALKQRVADAGLADVVTFMPGIENSKAPALYAAHQIYVNLGRSGMLDKTIFEAAATGCIVLAASDDWKEFAGDDYCFDGTKEGLVRMLNDLLMRPMLYPHTGVVSEHSLTHLGVRIAEEVH